jgi:formylglycine-generating enzyme required for sulfatase activity
MKFVPLPKGTFYMAWNGKEGSAKKAEIKEDFEIAVHSVTQGQWQTVMSPVPRRVCTGPTRSTSPCPLATRHLAAPPSLIYNRNLPM